MGRVSEKIFCAFCKLSRKVYTKKHISWMNVLLSLMTSVMVMFIFWQEFNAKMFIIWAFCLAFVEIFIQVRWRMSVNCPYCGFDPVLYHRDRDALVQKVRTRLEEARQKPGLMLSRNNPLEHLPTVTSNEPRPIPGKELP